MGDLPNITPLTWTSAKQVLDHEAYDFTPWLADNLGLLSEALGLDELELVSTEWKVDTFSLDILARGSDADGEVAVVIENQYNDTNHSHLGQLLTYSAGAAAQGGRVLAVWLVENIRPAHLAAVEFLNRIASGEDSTFGIVLMRVRFTPSPDGYYVYFEVEAQPNSFVNTTPHLQAKTQKVITEQAEFIDAVAAQVDHALLGIGLLRQGQVNKKHGAVAYRIPKDIELSGYGNFRVVCTSAYTNVAIYLGRQPTPQGNWAVADLLRTTYEHLVSDYGLRVDDWHGSGASTRRDRVITRLNEGYGSGSPAEVAEQATLVLTAWTRILRDHPMSGIESALMDSEEE